MCFALPKFAVRRSAFVRFDGHFANSLSKSIICPCVLSMMPNVLSVCVSSHSLSISIVTGLWLLLSNITKCHSAPCFMNDNRHARNSSGVL